MTNHDNRPRPYSRLNPATGRIEWVTPEERAEGKARRSRLENDAEVRARLSAAGLTWYGRITGTELDTGLKVHGLEPRKFVDE